MDKTNDTPDLDGILDLLKYRSGFFFGEAAGYNDLKCEENRQFMLGMAMAYKRIEDAGVDTDMYEVTGSNMLDEILMQVRRDTVKTVLEGLQYWMEEVLTDMLDDEANQETEE